MKKIIFVNLLSTLTILAIDIDIDMDKLSYGVGVGQIYNGFGGNVHIASQKEMKYIALGCTEFSDEDNKDREGICGLGVGYLRTDILPRYLPKFFSDTDKHGVGASFSIMNNDYTNKVDLLFAYGYTYFTEGISNSGWNFGVSPTYQYSKGADDNLGIIMNIGYQF